MNVLVCLGFFTVLIGACLHFNVEVPGFQWVGKLPGDLIVKKGEVSIYFPFCTSLLLSLGISSLLQLLKAR